MANGGLLYYKVDTDRYDDIRIKKLKKDCGASGVAIYDYILCQIYKGQGYYIVDDEELVFAVADYLNVKRQNVSEVIGYACATGLFNKELRTRESILTSVAIQKRWLALAKRTKRNMPTVVEEYWLLPSEGVVQQKANVGQQMADVVQQNGNVVQQMPNVVQQTANVVQQLDNMETEKETEKENSPQTPYKEKDKEKEHPKSAGAQEIFAADEVETITTPPNEPTAQTLTPAEKREQAIKNCKKRMDDFYNSLVPFVEQYGKEMIREFYDYWSEPTRSGTQMRCETERTFELTRRLATWARRQNAYQNDRRFSTTRAGSGNTTTPTNNAPSDRYAEISEFIGATII